MIGNSTVCVDLIYHAGWEQEASRHGATLFERSERRVVEAVERAGCRGGRRRRVSAGDSTAIEWCRGSADWQRVAGQDRRLRPKKLIGPGGEWAGAVPGRRVHPARAGGELAERGMKVDYRVVWEFVHAEGLTHRKRR